MAAGDVVAIIQGFEAGGVLGGIESGFATNALIEVLATDQSFLAGTFPELAALGPWALPLGIVVGLAALFFGGHHDNAGAMPDKYDTQNYGQGAANLKGSAGANGEQFTENPNLVNLFSGRTGIQMVEETLAMYGTADGAPAWLRPQFNKLEAMFGESTTGAGRLSVGNGGSGRDCNNQQIVGVPETSGQVYQYTQLDAALASFQAAYANAAAAGQAARLSWVSAASPGSVPPSDTYTSTSYQSTDYVA